MSYRQGYEELEGRFATMVASTSASGTDLIFSGLVVDNAEMAIGAASGATIGSSSVGLEHINVAAVSGNRITSGGISFAHLTANVASGNRVSAEYGPVGLGSPIAFGNFTQAGSGTTGAASGLWVVFGRAFASTPHVLCSSTIASTVVIAAPGSVNLGSFFAASEGASRSFNWLAVGSGR